MTGPWTGLGLPGGIQGLWNGSCKLVSREEEEEELEENVEELIPYTVVRTAGTDSATMYGTVWFMSRNTVSWNMVSVQEQCSFEQNASCSSELYMQ